MNAIPFDTLKIASRLKAVGFTDAQAEAIVEIQREASNDTLEQAKHDYHLDDVATKRDLKELEIALKHDLKELETALKHDLKESETALKHDLKELETTLRHETELLRADTGRLIAETKADLTRWIIGAGFLQTTLIIGVLLKLAHLI